MKKIRKQRVKILRLFLLPFFLSLTLVSAILIIKSYQKPFCVNSISCKESFNLKVENDAVGIFDSQKIIPPKVDLAQNEPSTDVLGDETVSGDKHIYINLTTQTLTAYQGNTIYMTAPVSSGKWHPTPTGDFNIWEKIRATRMTGGEGNDFYDLPNVPYVMFFSGPNASTGEGFSLHGAYWHDNFGHPMSHGCVNMRIVDAKKLYYWSNPPTNGNYTTATKDSPGTAITIYGQAPI